jgi:hypothetical protein
MPSFPIAEESWIKVDLPLDATQLDYGWELYRLVCSACHAYDGTGLTKRWRSTWGVEDQNCWQSKCHASNHPPDGFELPFAPAIVGSGIRAQFPTAYELFEYNLNRMPWHVPGTMAEEEIWAVTAFVLQLNRIDPGPVLNAETAREIQIGAPAPTATPVTTEAPPSVESTPAFVVTPQRVVLENATDGFNPAGAFAMVTLVAGIFIGLMIVGYYVFLK